MDSKPNFGDADFEPTDSQLAQLMAEAFEGVKARSDASLTKLRNEIRRLTQQALENAVANVGSE